MRHRLSFVNPALCAVAGCLCLALSEGILVAADAIAKPKVDTNTVANPTADPAAAAKPKADTNTLAKPKPDTSPKLQLESLLIWGTNDRQSPDPTHKPVDADILKKLQKLPLKWTNYFVVNRKVVEVATASPVKIAMSDKCELEVKNLGNANIEVAYFGKREQVVKQALPKGDTLLVGGNAPDSTAWLVVLRRLE